MTNKNYGVDFNFSMVHQDGKYNIGTHVTDTEGMDISTTQDGTNLTTCVEDLINNLYDGFIEEYLGEEEEKTEVDILHEQIAAQERKIAELEKQLNNQKKTVSVSYKPFGKHSETSTTSAPVPQTKKKSKHDSLSEQYDNLYNEILNEIFGR